MKILAYKQTKHGSKLRILSYNLEYIQVEDGDKSKKYYLGVDLIGIKWTLDIQEAYMIFQLEELKELKFKIDINELINLKTQLDGKVIYSGFEQFYYFLKHSDSQHTCFNKITNTKYHYQILKFSDHFINYINKQNRKNILQLVKILNQNQLYYFLHIHEVYIEQNNTLIILYEDYEQIYILKPYEEELRSFLSSQQLLDKINIINQLLKCVQTLHNLGIIHRNLSLKSFKLKNGQVKLSGFDLSLLEDDNHHFISRCGTLGMIAPEIYHGSPY